ncbi:MAG: hypothetical protein GXP30_04090, partial [Verrucomicrobia bacterium]|nr:hypothetical protein [Verrucomicrobiota bacterium]
MTDHKHDHEQEHKQDHQHGEDSDSCETDDSSCSPCSFDPSDFRPESNQAEPTIDAPSVTRLAVEGVDCPDEAKLI